MPGDIHYARNKEGQHVAYRVTGDGPVDLVFIPDWVTNLDVMREEPAIARFCDRLATFSRLIELDKRGSGLSDPVPLGAIPTPEEWMDDVSTVLDDLGVEQASLFGHAEGGIMATMFAATFPARTRSLILLDSAARRTRAEDYPWGIPEDVTQKYIERIIATWGTGLAASIGGSRMLSDPSFLPTRARLERNAMSPGAFAAIYPTTYEIDIRSVLPSIRVPTLVMHRHENPYIRLGNGRYLADHIDGAQWLELRGDQHLFCSGNQDEIIGAVQEFLTGARAPTDSDRVLATVLFTDIVGATELAGQIGDRAWKTLLARHHDLVRRELARFRGREIDTAGDGFFATFDGPARGVRCALAIRDAMQSLGLSVRAGLHIGECELMGDKVGGIAVHIGARVQAAAAAGEVLVSRTIKDLVAGSGLQFHSRGDFDLKGVSGGWELFAAS